jgi:hypothetical protein
VQITGVFCDWYVGLKSLSEKGLLHMGGGKAPLYNLCENQLLGKALSERHQQLEWAIEPNLPPQECPHHVFFLP